MKSTIILYHDGVYGRKIASTNDTRIVITQDPEHFDYIVDGFNKGEFNGTLKTRNITPKFPENNPLKIEMEHADKIGEMWKKLDQMDDSDREYLFTLINHAWLQRKSVKA